MFTDAVHHLIVQPDDGIEPILKTIDKAKKSLDIKMFQFTDPILIHAVIEAHKRGVKVRVAFWIWSCSSITCRRHPTLKRSAPSARL